MTPSEKEIWDEAFKVAIAACRDHVKFAGPRDYSHKVGEAFVQSIRTFKKKAEIEKAKAAYVIVVRYSTSPMSAGRFSPEDRTTRLHLPGEARDWPLLKTQEFVFPILKKKHPDCVVNVRGVDWNPPDLEITNDHAS